MQPPTPPPRSAAATTGCVAVLALLAFAAVGCDSGRAQPPISGADPHPCLGLPVCGQGQVQLKVACGNSSCREVSMCGHTIWCAEAVADPVPTPTPLHDDNLPSAGGVCEAEPMCAGGEEQVPSCAGHPLCREVTECGQTISCAAKKS